MFNIRGQYFSNTGATNLLVPALEKLKHSVLIAGKEYVCRKPTPIECERLQTLEDNYTDGVSNAQRYKMLGSGWTVDVICHIFSFLKYPSKKRQKIDLFEQMSLF